ncbi:glycosyltransferase [Corynebacterium lubricantis]|uniref:glycosyltransferase n=1 Tax=Corynebacterium lubricantis TaxID=541095 RepID=UPI00037F5C8A|nr:glycosyltransferase [Corynebacterium lubricantis]
MERLRSYDRYADLPQFYLESVDDVLECPTVSGLYTYPVANEIVDFIYESGESDVTLICFASASNNDSEAPKIEGRTFASKNGMSLLAFADPSVAYDSSITTNYMMGNKDHDFHSSIESIVRHFVGNGRKIFFGVSGGGFPALKIGSLFPDSLSFVVNPRVNILLGKTNFRVNKKLLYGTLSYGELAKLKGLSIRSVDNTVLYIQNIGDENYFGFQMAPYIAQFGHGANVWSFLGNWGKGHIAMPGRERSALIKYLIQSETWADGLEAIATRFRSLEDLQVTRAEIELSEANPSEKVLEIIAQSKLEAKVNQKLSELRKINDFLNEMAYSEAPKKVGSEKPLIIGSTRFSVFMPDSGAYKASNGSRFNSTEEYLEYLYSDERLISRARLFLTISLPQIARAAENSRFVHVVSYSENLPQEYKELLLKAEEVFSFVVLEEVALGDDVKMAYSIFEDRCKPGEAVGMFRLDDDDILSANYFRMIEKYVHPCFAGMRVSLPSGYVAIWNEEEVSFVRDAYRPLISIGMLSILKKEEDHSITEPPVAPHKTADRFGPVITDATASAFLWLRHSQQDTELNRSVIADPIDRLQRELVRIGAAADRAEFLKEFPVLVDSISAQSKIALLNEPTKMGRKLTVGLSEKLQSFDLEFSIRAGSGVDPRNLLLSLVLETSGGRSEVPVIDVEGFNVHKDPEIGVYQIVRLKRGLRNYSVSVNLPNNFYCTAVNLIKNKRLETRIDIHSAYAIFEK